MLSYAVALALVAPATQTSWDDPSRKGVGTGVGSLTGLAAGLLVIAVLGFFAWWTSRSSPRRRRQEAMRREAKQHDGPPPGLDLRDADLWRGRHRD